MHMHAYVGLTEFSQSTERAVSEIDYTLMYLSWSFPVFVFREPFHTFMR